MSNILTKYTIISTLVLTACSFDTPQEQIINEPAIITIDQDLSTYDIQLTNNKNLIQQLELCCQQIVQNRKNHIKIMYSGNKTQHHAQLVESVKLNFIKKGIEAKNILIQENIDNKITLPHMQITASSYHAIPPKKSEWQYSLGDMDTTKEIPNFGTSTAANFAMMVANPKVLIEPEELAQPSAKDYTDQQTQNSSNSSSSTSSNTSSSSTSSSSNSSSSLSSVL